MVILGTWYNRSPNRIDNLYLLVGSVHRGTVNRAPKPQILMHCWVVTVNNNHIQVWLDVTPVILTHPLGTSLHTHDKSIIYTSTRKCVDETGSTPTQGLGKTLIRPPGRVNLGFGRVPWLSTQLCPVDKQLFVNK